MAAKRVIVTLAKQDDVRALAPAANDIIYFTSGTAIGKFASSSFGRTLIGAADAAAGRTAFGLGTSATANTGTSGATIPLLNANNTFSGTVTFTSAYNVTISAKTLTVSQNMITTNDTELVLQQTGDAFGATRLRILCRNGAAGAIFEADPFDLVDFIFKGNTATQRQIRYENRGGADNYIAAPEFQIGGSDADPSFVISDNEIFSRRGPLRLKEVTVAPGTPVAGSQAQIYMKADKLVVAYNDGGAMKYRTMTLTGTANPAVWDYSTVAP